MSSLNVSGFERSLFKLPHFFSDSFLKIQFHCKRLCELMYSFPPSAPPPTLSFSFSFIHLATSKRRTKSTREYDIIALLDVEESDQLELNLNMRYWFTEEFLVKYTALHLPINKTHCPDINLHRQADINTYSLN